LSSPATVSAQIYSFETHGKEIDRATKVVAIPEFGAFGDAVDYSSGATIFRKTVVSVPGNNKLRVAVDFIVRLTTKPGGDPYYSWERDIPYLEGTHSSEYGWVVGFAPTNYSKNRCSDPRAQTPGGGAATITIRKPLDNIIPTDYWDGNTLYTPDAGGGIIRPVSFDEFRPAGVDVKWATNDGWRFSCYALADGSEGFIGYRANGDKYYFGIPTALGHNLQIISPNRPDVDGWLDVDKYRMYVTRIEDRFGNWVDYGTNAITSSDGRSITFANTPAGLVVSTNGKQWTIAGQSYLTGNPAMTSTHSMSIANPDSSRWQFAVEGWIRQSFSNTSHACIGQNQVSSEYLGQMKVIVTTEAAAVGTFIFEPRRLGYSYVDYRCDIAQGGDKGGTSFSHYMHVLDAPALVSRSVTGPGVQPYTHYIDYGPVNACYRPPAVWDACTPSSPTTRTTTITGSDGTIRSLTYGNKYDFNAGVLLAESQAGTRTDLFDQVALYENALGSGKRALGYDVSSYKVFRTRLRRTVIDGRQYSEEVPSTCGPGGDLPCFDRFFRPLRISKSAGPAP